MKSFGILAAALGAMPVTAAAQSAADGAPRAGEIQELVVTAQRREERLQEVPIAVAALSQQALATAGVAAMESLQTAVPGLTMTVSIDKPKFYLRGVGTQGAPPGSESAVSVYVDGVYYAVASSLNFGLTNVSRVEVLKGPQGTLFGRNATGGLINVITRNPSSEPTLQGTIGYGNYNTLNTDLYATAGLTDTLAADFAYSRSWQGDGWGHDLVTGKEVNFRRDDLARAKLRWTPTDDTDVVLALDYQRGRSDIGLARNVRPGTVAIFGTRFRGSIYDSQSDQPFYHKLIGKGAALTINQNFGDVNLTSITAYRKYRSINVYDMDLGAVNFLATPAFVDFAKTFQQEFVLNGSFDKLNWTAGAIYFHADTEVKPLQLRGTANRAVNVDRFGDYGLKSYAVFAQGEYELTEKTRATVGVRYTKDKRTMVGSNVVGPGNALPAGTVLLAASRKASFPKVTYRFALDHKINDDVMAYVSYSRGFKSGEFNAINAAQPAIEPETLDAAEIGLKSEFLDRRVRLNLSAYRYDYKNIQMQSVQQGTTFVLNAAKGRIWGAEGDLTAIVYDNVARVELNASAAIVDATYKRFPNAPFTSPNPAGGNFQVFADASGNRMIQAPKFAGTLGASYKIPVRTLLFQADATYNHTGGFYWDPDNRVYQEAVDLVNAQVAIGQADGQWRVRAYVRNAFDKKYFQMATNNTTADAMAPAPPRTYGMALDFKF